jgi:hypothetical protein
VLEFHMPFYALRGADYSSDARDKAPNFMSKTRAHSGKLRASQVLPLEFSSEEGKLYYHEAQISFLIYGVDEWFWTAYFFEDDYFKFNSKDSREKDWSGPDNRGIDAPIGREHSLKHPVWNPRQYFLIVLSRRTTQITKEWRNLISAFEERMTEYVSINSLP